MKPKMLTRSSVAENLGLSVLTPTTLKSITQILESEAVLNGGAEDLFSSSDPIIPSVILHSEGGHTLKNTFVNSDAKSWQGGTTTVVTPSSLLPQTLLDKQQDMDRRKENNINSNNNNNNSSNSSVRSSARRASRKVGGRRPFNKQELSPEEEARLQVRRERNKEAAARCRKRRMDQTQDLLEQVQEHERVKRSLEEEIRSLQCTREELQFLLQSHSKTCPLQQPQEQPQQVIQRPNSLALSSGRLPSQQVGLPSPLSLPFMDAAFIETPSNALNFESFLSNSSTGLTPLSANMPTPVLFSPTCSTQQREHDKSNSDSLNLVSL